ncbi:MAG: YcxB family protein [Parafilimonas sp.]
MRFSFSYNKKKVLQALRYHFISQKEIRILFIVIIVFDIVSGILYFMGKIRPDPFLLGSAIWFFFLISFWVLLPGIVYKRSATFREAFTIYFQPSYIALENGNGRVEWEWKKFIGYFESPNFFHLYFSAKSFFLVPKDTMSKDEHHEVRVLLGNHIQKK